MTPQTFIFIGQSGSGKDTQADLLDAILREKSPEIPIFQLEPGEKFREFVKGDNYTQVLSKKIAEKGKLQPSFLAVHIWSHLLIQGMQENQHVFFNGVPRSLPEVAILDTALSFYDRTATVIYLDVSDAWARERMTERQRVDDVTKERVDNRLRWFYTSVVPTIEYMKENRNYNVITINGEQTIEQVHADIMSVLSL